jgi:hypothetical protein
MEIACMCVMISSFHSRTAHVLWDQGGLHTRGRDGGWDAPCIPVCGHLFTQRYAIVHTCTVECSRPPLCRAHCPLTMCYTHALATALRPQCTLAETPQCTHAKQFFRPHSGFSNPSLHLPPLPPHLGCGMHSLTRTTTAACRFDV